MIFLEKIILNIQQAVINIVTPYTNNILLNSKSSSFTQVKTKGSTKIKKWNKKIIVCLKKVETEEDFFVFMVHNFGFFWDVLVFLKLVYLG